MDDADAVFVDVALVVAVDDPVDVSEEVIVEECDVV